MLLVMPQTSCCCYCCCLFFSSFFLEISLRAGRLSSTIHPRTLSSTCHLLAGHVCRVLKNILRVEFLFGCTTYFDLSRSSLAVTSSVVVHQNERWDPGFCEIESCQLCNLSSTLSRFSSKFYMKNSFGHAEMTHFVYTNKEVPVL